jgi:hypothetical protein
LWNTFARLFGSSAMAWHLPMWKEQMRTNTPNRLGPNDGSDEPADLASTICYFRDKELRQELEQFRVSFERESGTKTDLTRRYTCTWPAVQQRWLIDHHPDRFFAGLPPFVQAFYRAKMSAARRSGRLDDMPAPMLSLFLNGAMDLIISKHS